MSRPAPPVPDSPPRGFDLTINKVLAGALAAATAAVIGSLLGAAGTVVGAAVGSMASTVATAVYLSSLERTAHTVRTRLAPRRNGPADDPADADAGAEPVEDDAADADAGPAVDDPEDEDEVAPVPPPPSRRWRSAVIGTVLAFVIGVGVITGLEFVKGSTITRSEPGTSLQQVVAPAPATDQEEGTEDGTTEDESSTDGSTDTTDAESTDTPDNDERSEDESGTPSTDDETTDEPATPTAGTDGAAATSRPR